MYELNKEIEVTKTANTTGIKPKSKFKKGPIITALGIIIFLGASLFLYFRFNNLNNELNRYKDISNSGSIEQEKVQQILDDIAKLMLLPNETPTVAALIDVSGLKQDNPSFYKNALDGDILIIYTDKAILYREQDNLIINVAPVFIEPAEVNVETDNSILEEESEVEFLIESSE